MSRRKQPWNIRGITSPLQSDPEDILEFCNSFRNPDNLRFKAYFVNQAHTSRFINFKTLKKALANNVLDLEVSTYINQLEENPAYWANIKNPKSREYRFRVKRGYPIGCRIDIDGGEFGDITDVFNRAVKMWPWTIAVTETSPKRFHIWLAGTHFWSWNTTKVLNFCCKFAGLRPSSFLNEAAMKDAIRKEGIDPNCAYNIERAMMRIGGSINCKYSIQNEGDTTQIKEWVCRSMINKNRPIEDESLLTRDLLDLNAAFPKTPIIEENLKPVKSGIRYRSGIKEIVLLAIENDEVADKVSEKLADFCSKLLENNYDIPQKIWAAELGISQAGVSRLIDRLKELKVLKVTNDYYHPGVKAKTYGAGEKMIEIITKSKEETPPRKETKTQFVARKVGELLEPYVDGQVFEHFLKDLRTLHLLGMSLEDAEAFFAHKQKHRHRSKIRPAAEVRNAWMKFDAKANWTKKTNPDIDIKEVIGRM